MMAEPAKKLGVAYCRVSTGGQYRSGYGIEAQREALRLFAIREGLALAGLEDGDMRFVEAKTGKGVDALERRPKLKAAIAEARRLGGPVVVAKLDRLSRNVAFISRLMAERVSFVAADMPHADAFRLHLEAAIAEDEMKKISMRTKAALAVAKARGVQLGGFRENAPDLRLYQPAGSAEAARKAADFAASVRPLVEELKAEGLSLRAIAAELDRRRIPAMRGGKWRASAVQNLLLRAAPPKGVYAPQALRSSPDEQ